MRYETITVVMRDLARKEGFNPQLSIERASQILYAAVSEETYGLLVAEYHWSVEDWIDWAARATTAELFPPDIPRSDVPRV